MPRGMHAGSHGCDDNEREKFEERVYQKYFLSCVERDAKLRSDVKFKAELMARDENGDYYDDAISAMWFGWCLRAEH